MRQEESFFYLLAHSPNVNSGWAWAGNKASSLEFNPDLQLGWWGPNTWACTTASSGLHEWEPGVRMQTQEPNQVFLDGMRALSLPAWMPTLCKAFHEIEPTCNKLFKWLSKYCEAQKDGNTFDTNLLLTRWLSPLLTSNCPLLARTQKIQVQQGMQFWGILKQVTMN